MTNAGAKFIARGMPVATFENGIMQRTVIAEFETTEAAKAAFSSDTYKAAFQLLGDVERDVRIIEGFEWDAKPLDFLLCLVEGFAWFVETLNGTINMTEVINEIVAAIDQIVFWLQVTVYFILGICIVWVIGFVRRNLGLDNHSIELKRIRRILEDQISQK